MSEWDGIYLVHSVGVLVLVGSALLAYRLPLGQAVKMAAIWVLIFGAAFLAVSAYRSFVGGSSSEPRTGNEKASDGPWIITPDHAIHNLT
ncbi:MAG: hypothetical protein AAFX04_06325 [Pseudomonadota bacterium]